MSPAPLPFWPTDSTHVLADIVYLVIVFGGPVLIHAAYKYYKTHVSIQEQQYIEDMIRRYAPEVVLYVEHFVSGPGKDKFDAAIKRITSLLNKAGISNVEIGILEQAIQAAFAELKTKGILAASAPVPVTTETK